MRLALAVALVLLAGCTEIITYYPVCEETTIHLDPITLGVDSVTVGTLAAPSAECIDEFLKTPLP